MPNGIEFKRNGRADRIHAQALAQATKVGDYETAHKLFRKAVDVLYVPLSQELIDNKSRSLQYARILRDDGFTHVREALEHDAAGYLYLAKDILNQSRKATLDMVEIGWQHYSGPAWGELLAEHAATLGTLGRLATVAYVMGEEVDEETSRAMENYGAAYMFAKDGSNKYYETSIAITGARHLRIRGHIFKSAVWATRAARARGKAQKEDPASYDAARQTFHDRLPHLYTKKRAIDSVWQKP